MKKHFTLLLPILALLPTATPLTWDFDTSGATCDGSPFASDTITVSCNGQSSCTLGDTAIVSGNLTAVKSFDSGSFIVLQPCISSYCPTKYSYSAGGVCEEWLTPEDNQECGEEGGYSVDYTIEIPNKLPEYLSWLATVSNAMTVKVIMKQEVECEVEASGYEMVYSMLGLTTAAMVCVGAYAKKKRERMMKRRVRGVMSHLVEII
ncbi:hypothetical protein HJC23_013072 [Cyclotella cryptica]|uniref:Uncharacterized protein n=1 Tax=Cyclotella cryptica TaxID=29204 RepID=A0ABD3Q7A0_9STRA|eukprot:CCRYP_008115-RA/>CCRYP_008115-RA protein AED:0.01 eAED:0.01 QI:52/-1/1/1/-1/1/1/304/205